MLAQAYARLLEEEGDLEAARRVRGSEAHVSSLHAISTVAFSNGIASRAEAEALLSRMPVLAGAGHQHQPRAHGARRRESGCSDPVP